MVVALVVEPALEAIGIGTEPPRVVQPVRENWRLVFAAIWEQLFVRLSAATVLPTNGTIVGAVNARRSAKRLPQPPRQPQLMLLHLPLPKPILKPMATPIHQRLLQLEELEEILV